MGFTKLISSQEVQARTQQKDLISQQRLDFKFKSQQKPHWPIASC